LPSKDKRHQEVVKKIKLIMRDVSKDIITGEAMPILDVPKVGYDNTVWSDQKRMLTIGDKKVQVSPDSTKKIPTFTQYIVMASAIRRLLDEEMESTIRGMYYATQEEMKKTNKNSGIARKTPTMRLKQLSCLQEYQEKNFLLRQNQKE
jgi:DNA topoisomerase VI subunit A